MKWYAVVLSACGKTWSKHHVIYVLIWCLQSTLNNAEVSCEYIQTLKENLEEEIAKLYGSVSAQGKAKLQVNYMAQSAHRAKLNYR